MAEEEHEVYGGDLPEEGEGDGEYEGDLETHVDDVTGGAGGEGGGAGVSGSQDPEGGGGEAGGAAGEGDAAMGGEGGEGAGAGPSGAAGDESMMPEDAASKELEEMKKRLKEMEEEAAALREMQAKVEKEMGGVSDGSDPNAISQASREEADARSVFVGNVDYACTPEEVQQHFQSCGTVNRVTILTDKFGHPKGFAYVEFLEVEAVQNAILLNESELHGRPLKVVAKRTNVPGMRNPRFRRFNPYFRPRRPYFPPALGGIGRIPRFRRPVRFRPYSPYY